MLRRLDELASASESFVFETTLSGSSYLKKIEKWKKLGYYVILYSLKLPSVEIAKGRVKLRVSEGGHNIPENVIERRFERGLENFDKYKGIVDLWILYDSSMYSPTLIEEGING